MTRFPSAARVLLLGGLLASSAQSQTTEAKTLARQLDLKPGEYTLTQEVAALGVRAPGGAVRLQAPRPVRGFSATDLRRVQESLPSAYGAECTAPLQLTLVPTSLQGAAALVDRWTRETSGLVLRRSRADAAFLSGRAEEPVLTTVRQISSALVVASCPVRDSVAGLNAWVPVGQFADPQTLVAFDWFGTLAWCREGTPEPARNVQAYAGGVQLAERSPDGRRVATVGWDRGGLVLKVWRSQDAALLARAPVKGTALGLSFTEDGRSVFLDIQEDAVPAARVVVRLDAESGREQGRLVLPEGERPQAVSGDGRLVATTSIRSLRVREVAGGRALWTVPYRQQDTAFAFARGDGWLGGADPQGRLEAWRVSDGQRAASTKVPVRAQVRLRPGLQPGGLSVITVEATSVSAPGRWTLLSWTPGGSGLKSLGAVNVTGREGVVFHAQTGTPQVVPFCQVDAGLPFPLSGR